MKLRCPGCGREYDWREAIKDRDLMEIIRMQADFAPHSRLVMEYAELFDTTRPIKAAKLRRVLEEIKEVFVNSGFNFNRRRYAISKDGIAAALKVVCNKNFSSPLENHNYLKKVMLSVSEEEGKRRSVEAEKALREKEARLRAGIRPQSPASPLSRGQAPGEEERPVKAGDIAKSVPWRKG